MPVIGYSTCRIPPDLTERCIRDAFEAGCRLIDTGECGPGTSPAGEGTSDALRASGFHREEVFLAARLRGCCSREETEEAVDRCLKDRGLAYLDLLLLENMPGSQSEAWRALETAQYRGKVRAIGAADLDVPAFDRLMRTAHTVPAVVQAPVSVFGQQEALRRRAAECGAVMAAWGPLAAGANDFFRNPTLNGIGLRRGKTAAQIALRWLYQRGIVPFPGTTRPGHLKEDLDIFDFELNAIEMREIAALEIDETE